MLLHAIGIGGGFVLVCVGAWAWNDSVGVHQQVADPQGAPVASVRVSLVKDSGMAVQAASGEA